MKAVIDEDLHRSLKPILESLGFTVFDIIVSPNQIRIRSAKVTS